MSRVSLTFRSQDDIGHPKPLPPWQTRRELGKQRVSINMVQLSPLSRMTGKRPLVGRRSARCQYVSRPHSSQNTGIKIGHEAPFPTTRKFKNVKPTSANAVQCPPLKLPKAPRQQSPTQTMPLCPSRHHRFVSASICDGVQLRQTRLDKNQPCRYWTVRAGCASVNSSRRHTETVRPERLILSDEPHRVINAATKTFY
jgi:hypothetical protein